MVLALVLVAAAPYILRTARCPGVNLLVSSPASPALAKARLASQRALANALVTDAVVREAASIQVRTRAVVFSMCARRPQALR
jgi:hypothetical protein